MRGGNYNQEYDDDYGDDDNDDDDGDDHNYNDRKVGGRPEVRSFNWDLSFPNEWTQRHFLLLLLNIDNNNNTQIPDGLLTIINTTSKAALD